VNQQEELAHSSGEIVEPETLCEHRYVRFNASTGTTRCLNPECDAEVSISELSEELPAEGPYDLLLDLGELGGTVLRD
jgi:hypothetical protein